MKCAVILAGGFGTRLQSIGLTVPKSLAPIAGRPLLEYLLDEILRFGISDVTLCVGHLAEQIQEHFGAAYKGAKVTYLTEDKPLGTGGAMRVALQQPRVSASGPVAVFNGDVFFDADLNALEELHRSRASLFTLGLFRVGQADRFGSVDIDDSGRILAFREKQPLTNALINGGAYVVSPDVFEGLGLSESFSVEKDFFEPYLKQMPIYGLPTGTRFLDIGVPGDYALAQTEIPKWVNR